MIDGGRMLKQVAATAMLAGFACLPCLALAQAQEGPGPGPADAAARDTATIPAAQIPAGASAARVTLDAIQARLKSGGRPDSSRLERFAISLSRLRQQPDLAQLDRVPEFRLAELQREVGFYQREFAALEARDVERATRLSTDAAELNRLRLLWARTLESAARDQLAQPLLDEARKVLQQISETERLLNAPLAETLAGRGQAGHQEASLETLARALDEASTRAAQRRLSRDSEPLWSAESFEVTPPRDVEALRARMQEELVYTRDFVAARRTELEAFALFAAAAFGLVLWLRRRPQLFAGAGENLPDASRMLARPFSSLTLILLVVALFSSEFLPSGIVNLIAFVVTIVLLRLMPKRLVAGHSSVLFGLIGLFVLDRLRTIMPFDSLAFRLDLLLVTVGLAVGFAGCGWLRRRGRLPDGSWVALVARLAPAGQVLMLVSVVANVVGNVSLADLLVRATLASTYVSAILFAAALIVGDFVLLFVRTRMGRFFRVATLHGDTIVRVSRRLIRAAALALWAYLTLVVFEAWDTIASRASSILANAWHLGELTVSLGGVLAFVGGVLIAVYAARATRFLLHEEILTRVPWPAGAKSTTATLVYYGVMFGGLLLALNAAGIQTSQFALVVGALGVGIGFGLQTVVNNFVSGLILMFERPIQPGDIIDIDTLQGKVVQIGLRATRIKTWEGAEVVVPNGTLLAGNLINWTLSDSNRRIDVPVGVAYGTDVRRVQEILTAVAVAQPTALDNPAPTVLFSGFGESSLDFVMRFWTRDASLTPGVRSAACVAVAEALRDEGIEIPFPQRDLHIRSMDSGVSQQLK
jgi:small-conductance mechanosensitive channel